MTENQIKEKISSLFFQSICANEGFACQKPELDYGVDLQVTKIAQIDRNGKSRFLSTGQAVDFQLKSTTTSMVTEDGNFVKYDLESKTYNDLVNRSNDGNPLLLIVTILPSNRSSWIFTDFRKTILRARALWYNIPDNAEILSSEVTTKRIFIPKENIVDPTFLQTAFQIKYS